MQTLLIYRNTGGDQTVGGPHEKNEKTTHLHNLRNGGLFQFLTEVCAAIFCTKIRFKQGW